MYFIVLKRNSLRLGEIHTGSFIPEPRDVVSVTGKASSFALAIHHLIDGVLAVLRRR